MKTIKKIAGEILLYSYLLQRQDVSELRSAMLRFELWPLPREREGSGAMLAGRSQSIFNIKDFETYTDNDLYNALVYLHDSGLIDYNESRDSGGLNLLNLRVTAGGIDIIEGIERGKEEKKNFNMTFNFNITNEMTVESLLKAEFGPLIKASLI